jgi:AcrR family transcriptional regulator
MGVAERKERHKEELKGEILKAAKELYMEKGLEATSIRNIAEKIEYSPATVYLYFRDKGEILHALHQEGFKILVEYFTEAFKISDPFERLKALGEGYIRFSMERPEMYKLTFVMEEPIAHIDDCEDEWDEGEGAYQVLLNTVEACQKAGYFPTLEAHGVSFMIWSTMHGLCTLRGSGHLGHVCAATEVRPDVDSLMKYTFETFVKFLEGFKK